MNYGYARKTCMMIRRFLPCGAASILAAMAPVGVAEAAPGQPASGQAGAPKVSPERFPMMSPVGAPAPQPDAKSSAAPQPMPSPMSCPSDPVDLPPELAAWTKREPLLAARDTRSLSGARIEIGKAVEGGLRPTGEIRYATKPEKPGGSTSFGGLYTFRVPQAARYRVALGAAAWIDVVKAGARQTGGTVMASTGHGHGPDCSGVRKMVDFSLQPGTYLLQISGNAAARLPLLVARLP